MLVTLVEMKAFLGEVTNTYDTFLTDNITLISEAVETYCGRAFAETTYTQTFYEEELLELPVGKELTLYHYPVSTVTTVILGTPPTETVTDYRLIPKTGRLYRTLGWMGVGEIEVEYVAGFAAIPASIKNVVYNLVQERYAKQKSGIAINFGNNVQRVSIPGTISLDFDYTLQSNDRENAQGMFLGDYMNVLDMYRSERTVCGDVRNTYVV